MANENEVWIKLMGDINDINQKLNQLQMNSNSVSQKMSTNWLSTAKGIGAALGVAFSVRAIVNFGKESVLAFAKTEESASILNNTLKNFGVPETGISSVEDTIDALEKLTSFDDSEIRDALSRLSVQLGSGKTAAYGLQVAMQMSRFTGDNLGESVQKLGMGLLGSTRILKQFGIVTVEGKTKLEILNDLFERTKGTFDSHSSIVKGALDAEKVSFGNLQEAIGKSMSSSLKSVIWFSIGFLDSISGAVNSVGEFETSIGGMKQSGHDLARVGLIIGEAFSFAGNAIATTAYALTHKLGKETADAVTGDWDAFKEHWDTTWKNFNSEQITGTSNTEDTISKYFDRLEKDLGDFGLTADDIAKDSAQSFKAAWSAINIQGGNIPELAKFVGNLNMKPTIKKILDVNVNINDKSQVPTATSKAVVSALSRRLKAEIAYESHGTSTYGGL